MPDIKLSICIPTYNRGAFIGETIQSIIDASYGLHGIEIAISDNASVDNTQEIVNKYKNIFPNITYFRWDENMGADNNYLKVIEIASGDFCWLMGSDDKVESSSISVILKQLEEYSNLAGITVNVRTYDPKLSYEINSKPATKHKTNKFYQDDQECFIELGHYFGYISAQIVNKTLWQEIVSMYPLEKYFNAYVHIYVIARMLEKNSRWLYIHEKCVGWRSGNDSFLSEGRLKRLAIDVYGYEEIARDVYGLHSKPYDELLKTVVSVHIWHAILDAKVNKIPFSFYKEAFKMCFKTYKQYPIFWLKIVPLFLIPSVVMLGLRVIYRKYFKKKVLNEIYN